jgi:F0F1-type ATP synthase membrane subunit b/b'
MMRRLRVHAALLRWAALLICAGGLTFAPQVSAQEPAKSPESSRTEERGKDPWLWWKLGNLVILAAILGYLIKKHGGGFFERRTAQIQAGMREAEKTRREAEERVAEMERRIASLGDEIERMRSAMRHEMAAEGERIRLETEHHLNRIQFQAEQEIESMTKRARRELKMYAAGLALQSAEEQLKARVSKDLEDRLVASFIDDLRSRSSYN